ncbi:MAG: hypothetical protein CBB79_06340 [Synechococcus sp. TMED19]|nr:MAG: hypothetical protein CBB79_06340 [Synechococcus sp. TMED19]
MDLTLTFQLPLARCQVGCALAMEWKLVIMILVSHLASAFFSKTLAGQKARNSKKWFLAGLIFGPLGLIGAAGLADRHQIVYLRYLAEHAGYQPRHACGGNQDSTS